MNEKLGLDIIERASVSGGSAESKNGGAEGTGQKLLVHFPNL